MKVKKHINIKLGTIFISIGTFLAVFLVFIGILLYGFNFKNNLIVKEAYNIFPFPAAISFSIGTLSVKDLDKRVAAVKKFYEGQDFSDLGMRVDFSGEEGQKRLSIKEKDVLDKMIEEKIIEHLAKKRGIKVSNNMVKESLARKINEYSSEEYLKKNIFNLYGWQIEDFQKNIVKPDLLKENLKKFVRKNEVVFLEKKKQIEKAKSDLDSGKEFEEVVKSYSQGESAKNGGELGWFSKNQILPELSVTVYSMNKGETSDILESSLGYHIINLEDKKSENGKDFVKIKQIFIRNENFGDWLVEQKKKFNFYIPLKKYYWKKEDGKVEFSNNSMIEFEKKTLEGDTGDASMIF
jgi:parvulin-like peptidyl-prolyl isomerase